MQKLPFPKDGLVIGVEFLGSIGKDNNLIISNGTEVKIKIFLSQEDNQRNTWISLWVKALREKFTVKSIIATATL
ncbi:MAG: hypothetical protein JST43_02420 [Bacteroidetes bacterium]|nr:hypothetical protein [Bacteroidota bacterium]MBS1541169.1 hypothetical protein [Bacteroidota bacterium]